MTDPFSVGAGVVGVLSLGITVCQGLAAYYGPFTQFDSETKALVQKAEGLTSTLQQLETLLNPLQNPLNSPSNEVHLVTQRIKDCQGGLEGLSHALTKCRGYDATNVIKKSGWYYAQKALYPFKRGTLASLTGMVSNLQSNLDTALLVLNVALSKRLEDQTTLTLSVSRSIATGTTDISTTLSRLEQGQQQIFQAIQSFQQAGITSPRALPPAMLRSLCNQQQNINRHFQPGVRSRHVTKASCASCTCPQEPARGWKLLPKFQSHRFGCPLYFQEKTMAGFCRQYVVCNRILNFSIQFSMSAADGFTIHHFFNVLRVVPEDAPAFALLKTLPSGPEPIPEGFSLGGFLLQLRQLFEERKALPKDTLSDGTTLLHYVVGRVGISKSLYRPYYEWHPIYLEIIEMLALVCRVPLNEGPTCDGEEYTFLDGLLYHYLQWRSASPTVVHLTSLISKLLDSGGEITKLPETSYCVSNRLELSTPVACLLLPRVVNELCLQDFGLSDVETSILNRSEKDLRRSLGHHHTEQITISFVVCSSLVEWPLGLKLILESPLCSYSPSIRKSLFMMAISSSQKELVALLLAAGWPISSLSFEMAAHLPEGLEIFRMLVDALVKRRQQLLTLAREKLPLSELALHADMDDVPGQSSEIIYKALHKHVPGIDQIIIIDDGELFPVYKWIGCNCRAAEILYEAGFINVEEGHSPISCLLTPLRDELCDYLDLCCWFLGKGASFYSQFPGTSTLPIHHIAFVLGNQLCSDMYSSYSWGSRLLPCYWETAIYRHGKLLKDVLTDTEHRDSCFCACFVGGCLPSTIFMTQATRGLDLRSDDALANFFKFLDSVASDDVKEMHDILAPVVLRLCTFELLHITHTCRSHIMCHGTLGNVKISDVPEVQAEERHLIDRLEELVFEFEGKYKELNVPLPEFISGYWRDRMDEVEAEEEVFDEEEAQRMREIGVIVECPSPDSE